MHNEVDIMHFASCTQKCLTSSKVMYKMKEMWTVVTTSLE